MPPSKYSSQPPRFEDTSPIDEQPPKFEDTLPIEASSQPSPSKLDLLKSYGKSLGKGALSGATFGTMGKVDEVPDSVTNLINEPNPTTRKVGKFAGTIAPLVAASMTGGASLGASAAARGAGAFGTAVAQGMGTGLTYGAMEGGVRGEPVLDTVKNMVNTGNTFAGFSAAGQALGHARKLLGDKFSEWLANNFINTDQRLAEKLREQGKESLGKSFLTKTKLSGFKSRDEVYDQAGQELQGLERAIKNRLEDHAKSMRTPNVPNVPVKGTPLLEYRPGGVTEIKPSGFSGDKTIQTPTTITENVPSRTIPFRGTYKPSQIEMTSKIEPIEADVFGVPVRQLEKDITKSIPVMERIPTGPTYPQTELGGFERIREVGSRSPNVEVPIKRGNLAESVRGLNSPERFPIKGQRPGTVDFTETVKSLDGLKNRLDTGTELGKMKQIDNMQTAFLARNGENGSLDQAMILKRKLDDLAGNIYTKLNDAKSASKLEAYENMANNLRSQIYKIDPKLGELAAQESLLIRVRNGLLPKVAKSGGSRFANGFWASATNRLLGNEGANALSKGLQKGLGTPSKFVAPATRQATRSSLVSREDKNNSVLQELFQQ